MREGDIQDNSSPTFRHACTDGHVKLLSNGGIAGASWALSHGRLYITVCDVPRVKDDRVYGHATTGGVGADQGEQI